MVQDNEILLEIKDLCKNFGVTVALNHVSFAVRRGEIRGLIGENGSGKSTVSSIIAGMQNADSGKMFLEGREWKPSSALHAQQVGIAMIVQEAGTIPNITVAENIFLGHEKMFSKGFFINRRKMTAAARKLLEDQETNIEATRITGDIDMASRKLIEVAKSLYWKPKLFIVDETTTALSHTGRILLYKRMKELANGGGSVLFISHELDELMEQCDSLTVLRDGVIVGNLVKDEFDSGRIKQMMVGREIKGNYYRNDTEGFGDEVVLKAECITTMKDLLCFSVELHKGEILGIGGLSHCGMHTLGKALFGAERIVDGRVVVPGSGCVINNPKTAIKCRMGYVSKDRDTESLSLGASIRDNIASTGYRLNRLFGPFVSFRKEKNYVDEQIHTLSLKCASQYHSVNTLSGGNKQKTAIGKWLACDANILILDCPTRGIDIGVKTAMYKLIYEMKKTGKSIVLISEELPELIGMSDRILIMRNGEISCEMRRMENPAESALVEYML
ncbi:MAG: sugar ABC transporter ATP-binding protein [Treponema sp.]|jgi:ribose transport system ATP-binding protein|nr:sugar ABC transporter ATP-binding protein [Treponema sp.]